MRKMKLLIAALFLAPLAASAHPGHGGTFPAGLSHPMTGLDHLLAMVAVGALAIQIDRSARWALPATFVGMMVIGCVLGLSGAPLASMEMGIAVSVVVLGLALAAGRTFSSGIILPLVGLFAMFHGYAHGAEMPQTASYAVYAAGFILGTTGLHLAGILIGLAAQRSLHGAQCLRAAGAFMAAFGLHLLMS